VNLVDAEEQEMIGRNCDCNTDCNCEVVKPVDKDATLVDCVFCFDEYICEGIDAVIGDEENGNRKKEEKFPRRRRTSSSRRRRRSSRGTDDFR